MRATILYLTFDFLDVSKAVFHTGTQNPRVCGRDARRHIEVLDSPVGLCAWKIVPAVRFGTIKRAHVYPSITPMQKDVEVLKDKENHPHIIVGTPGRLNALVREKNLRLGTIKAFVLDECDKMLDQIGKHTYAAP